MKRVITFCSPKGGVGRTTLAANVAAALANEGRRVLALDLDPQNALRLSFGIPLSDRRGWARATLEGRRLHDEVLPASSNLLVLPFGITGGDEQSAVRDRLGQDAEWLEQTVSPFLAEDFTVVVDTPAGHSPYLDQALHADGAVIAVLRADAACLPLLPAIDAGLFGRSANGAIAALTLNMIDPRQRQFIETAKLIQAHFGSRMLANIRHDDNFGLALAQQRPVADHAPASRGAFETRALAQALITLIDAPVAKVRNVA